MMRWIAAAAVVAAVAAWGTTAEAKDKGRAKASASKTTDANSANAKADPNVAKTKAKDKGQKADAAKKPTPMSEQDIKAAQQQIEKAKLAAVQRHEDILKDLYSLRALAIKEHASETENAIDTMVEKERAKFGDADGAVKEPNSGKTKHKKKP